MGWFAAVVAAVLFAACGQPSPPGGDTPADDTGDIAVLDSTPQPDTDAADPDVATDADTGVLTDVDAAPDAACDTLGCDCEDNADCDSGYCVDTPGSDARVCSELCSETCSEPGFECRTLVNSEGDAVQLCVPVGDTWCAECETPADCGSLDAACYALDDDIPVCLVPCGDDSLCPEGASCTSLTTDAGDGRYCVPDSGLCRGCLDEDGDLHGVGPDCLGDDPDDLDDTVYDGAPELCDGLDNDGNGDIDEGFDLDTDAAHCGACGTACAVEGGVGVCVDGVCVVDACPDGLADCDGDYETGCETDLTDPLRCGTCTLPEGAPGAACGTCDTGVWTCGDEGDTACEGDAGDDALNACGGCEPLDAEPADPCGTCGSGRWVCNPDGGLDCVDDAGDDALNACGGCDTLEGDPEAACGTCDTGTWICASADAVTCIDDDGDAALNACGGCSTLDATPGEVCGTCDTGAWVCDGDEALTCADDAGDSALNACGGCDDLANEPGAACGRCGLDAYVCDGAESTVCDGDTAVNACGGCDDLANEPGAACGRCSVDEYVCDGTEATTCDGDTALNACGGCDDLANEPGAVCGSCGLDAYVCDGAEATACDGDTTVNVCGGCDDLAAAPGDACGTCGTGRWICNADGGLDCAGDLGDDALNACGGCDELDATPGSACGTCDSGLNTCASAELVVCVGDRGVLALNGCGGCTLLDAEPDDTCGPCGLDTWACDGTEAVACSGATLGNACGGCEALANEPGAACGSCGVNEYFCDGTDATVCDGDTTLNACGGCAPLAGDPGTACGLCGIDTWACDGTEAVACAGTNCPPSAPTVVTVSPGSPTNLGGLTCSASGSVDPEGAEVTYTYTWTLGGAPAPAARIEAGAVTRAGAGEVWACTATPSDGEASGGAATSDPVTVIDHCADGVQNGNETDVDCGGAASDVYPEPAACGRCGDGDACGDDSDCEIPLPCTGGVCACIAGDGLTAECAGIDCRAILDAGLSRGDGLYWVQPREEPRQVYCDMTRDGGGWTLLAAIRGDSSAHVSSAAVGVLLEPNQASVAKLSDAVIGEFEQHDPLTHTVAYRLDCQHTITRLMETDFIRFQNGWDSTAQPLTPNYTYEYACDDWSCVLESRWTYAGPPESVIWGPLSDHGGGSYPQYDAIGYHADAALGCHNNGNTNNGALWIRQLTIPVSSGRSCAEILGGAPDSPDGEYWIDPDGDGPIAPFEAYCDMTTDDGGWTLIAIGGASCATRDFGTSGLISMSSVGPDDVCSHLEGATVRSLAGVSEDVRLRSGSAFGASSREAFSSNALAIQALTSPTATWHNGSTWTGTMDWNWSCTPVRATGWPNMFQACGNGGGVHWTGTYWGHSWDAFSAHEITTTWVR